MLSRINSVVKHCHALSVLQVHCRYGNYESFGDGDLKEEGIKKFFATHVCNSLCKKMNLRPVSEYDFIPPKAVVQFPGISEVFLKELTHTLKAVRSRYGLAEPCCTIIQGGISERESGSNK